MISCSDSVVDLEKEKEVVRKELFINALDGFKNKDAVAAASIVPDNGNLLIADGKIIKYEKDTVIHHYERSFKNEGSYEYTILEGPNIDFFDNGQGCYGTIRIKMSITNKTDTASVVNDIIVSSLFVGQKQNGKWVSLVSSQTFETNN